MRWLACVSSVALASACSVLTNLDDLRNTSDATAPDVGAEPDAEPDVTSAPDSATFCAPYENVALAYCESFDTITDASMPTLVTGNATAIIDDADFVSPPASLLMQVPASDAGSVKSYLSRAIAVEPSKVVVDFELEVQSFANTSVNIAAIGIASTPINRTLVAILYVDGIQLQESAPGADGGIEYIDHPFINLTWNHTWHAIEIVLDIANKTSSLVVDGTTWEANYPLVPGWVKGLFTLNVGVTYANAPNAGYALRVDNVLAQLTL